MKQITRLLALTIAAVVLAGCAGSGEPEQDLSAAPKLNRAQAQKLYRKAHGFLKDDNDEQALKVYRQLEDTYPFTQFAVQAQMEEAFAQYRQNDPESALATVRRFIKEHPTYPTVDYAYYLKGLINFQRGTESDTFLFDVDEARRDQQYARQSFDDFALLLRRFPDSEYNADAKQRMVYLRNQLARSELYSAQYYFRRGAWIAANRRARDILNRYQGTPSVRQALLIMERSYRKLGLKQPADDTRKVLLASYPAFAREHQ